MSRLAEILGVREWQEFEVHGDRYRVNAVGVLEKRNKERTGFRQIDDTLAYFISHPENIKPLPPVYSPETIEALRRIATLWPEWPWIARDADGEVGLYHLAPRRSDEAFCPSDNDDFGVIELMGFAYKLPEITWAGGPEYIPDVTREATP